MKIRTDFVTNSSSSSFVTWNIDSPKLAETIKKIKEYEKGEDDSCVNRVWVTNDSLCATQKIGLNELFENGFPVNPEKMVRYVLKEICWDVGAEASQIVSDALKNITDYANDITHYYIAGGTTSSDGGKNIVGVTKYDKKEDWHTALVLDDRSYEELPKKYKKGYEQFWEYLRYMGFDEGINLLRAINKADNDIPKKEQKEIENDLTGVLEDWEYYNEGEEDLW